MIELTDTHCHIHSIDNRQGERITTELWSKAEDISIKSVIEEASQNNVTRLISVGTSLFDSELAIKAANNFQNVWASIGIHPHEAKDYVLDKAKQSQFIDLVNKPKVIAIGECGLDYFYDHSPRKDQIIILEMQLDLANRYNLPVIFHIREAFKDFWPILDNFKNIKGVVHSFTDNQSNLDKILSRGLFVGVNGIATFARDPNQREVYKAIPLAKLLLETDSPFLSPVPLRGRVNEPKNIKIIAGFLANLRNESLETLATNTNTNAIKLFDLR